MSSYKIHSMDIGQGDAKTTIDHCKTNMYAIFLKVVQGDVSDVVGPLIMT